MSSVLKVDKIQSDTGSINLASSLSGSLSFSGTGNRITGDFSNATIANRVMFQTSTVNGNSLVEIIPNGTGTQSSIVVSTASSDPANTSLGNLLAIGGTEIRLQSTIRGTGTYLPMTFQTGGSERMRINTSGKVLIGRTSDVTGETFSSTGYALVGDGTGSGQFIFGSAGADSFSGSFDNTPHVFRTHNAERMRIDIIGNVGIGLSSPATKLDVDGQISGKYTDVGTNTAAQDLAANHVSQVTISSNTTLTTTVPPAGTQAIVVIVTSGATSRTVTFGSGFASTGTLATGTTADRRFVVSFVSDGTRLLECSRTVAIAV
jgi:hypothetical protein